MKIDDITVGERHRKDLGDLDALADSIERRGLLHPPVVTTDGELVCGYRRLEAAKRLDWTEIEVRVIDPDDMLFAEHDENEIRKDFTTSERVAIARTIERRFGKRQGQRTDKQSSNGELPHHGAEVDPGEETRETAARGAGFESRESYRKAAKVVDDGIPELVEAVDEGKVSVSAAVEIAELPSDEQAEAVAAGPGAVKEKAKQSRRRKQAEKEAKEDQAPSDDPEVGARRWVERIDQLIQDVNLVLVSIPRRGGFAKLTRRWSRPWVTDLIGNLKALRELIDKGIAELEEVRTWSDRT